MNCAVARKLLSQEIDGAISPADEAALRVHEATCGPCRNERRELALAEELLRRHGQIRFELPPGLVDRAMKRLDSPAPVRRELSWLGLAAAALLAVLAAGAQGLPLVRASAPANVEAALDGVRSTSQYVAKELPGLIYARCLEVLGTRND